MEITDDAPTRRRPTRSGSEIIETVRRFVAQRGHPGGLGARARGRVSRPTSSSRCAQLGLFGVTIPEAYGGLGLDLLTYVGVIEELAYGWMSLTGIVNTHTMAATLLMAARQRGAEAALAARHGHRRAARGAVAVRARCRQRHPQHLVPGRARRRRVRRQRHQGLGDQRRAGRHRGAGRPHRGGHLRLHRREGARAAASRGSRSASTSASSATGASRPSRWPTSTTGSRPPT